MNNKKPSFRRTTISEEEYDAIHSAGYADCMRDMIDNFRNMLQVVEEQELDLEESVLGILKKAEETLNEDNTTVN